MTHLKNKPGTQTESSQKKKKMVKKHLKKKVHCPQKQEKCKSKIYPVRMAKIIKKNNNNKCWREKEIFIYSQWDCKLDPPYLEISVDSPKKQKVNLLDEPAIPLCVICPKDTTFYPTNTCSVISLVLYSQQLGNRNNLNAIQKMNR